MRSNKPLEVNPPLSARDRRPNDRPFYIDEYCPNCGTILTYSDLNRGELDWGKIMFDGFSCPQCQNGTYLDWTPKALERLTRAIERTKNRTYTPETDGIEEIKKMMKDANLDTDLDE
jgi:ribosomal protein S27AE